MMTTMTKSKNDNGIFYVTVCDGAVLKKNT
jgi:hypothetical protein